MVGRPYLSRLIEEISLFFSFILLETSERYIQLEAHGRIRSSISPI